MSGDGSTVPGSGQSESETRSSPAADGAPLGLDDPRAIQILATEHWSLLAARTLSWNESFSRTSMLLATLSAAMVALALAAQVAGFDAAFLAFALVVLAFVEVVGLATFARLGEANDEDLQSIQGMNRIRHAYLQIAPELEPYFVAARHDDLAALLSAYGMGPGSTSSVRGGLHHAFVMTQGMVGIVNAMVAGVFGFLLATGLGAATVGAAGAGALVLALAIGLQAVVGGSMYRRRRETMTVRFPSASNDDPPADPDTGRAGGTLDGDRRAETAGVVPIPPRARTGPAADEARGQSGVLVPGSAASILGVPTRPPSRRPRPSDEPQLGVTR